MSSCASPPRSTPRHSPVTTALTDARSTHHLARWPRFLASLGMTSPRAPPLASRPSPLGSSASRIPHHASRAVSCVLQLVARHALQLVVAQRGALAGARLVALHESRQTI